MISAALSLILFLAQVEVLVDRTVRKPGGDHDLGNGCAFIVHAQGFLDPNAFAVHQSQSHISGLEPEWALLKDSCHLYTIYGILLA